MSNAEYYNHEEYTRRRRDPSPGHYSGGGPPSMNNAPAPPPPHAGATGPPPPMSTSGAPPYASSSRLDEHYRPPSPREQMHLEPMPASHRPRSVPPSNTAMIRRQSSRASSRSSFSSDDDDRDRHRSRSHRSDRDRSPSPMGRARNVVEDNFSNSATGIGAGLLGAVVGGLVAREASEAAARHKHKIKGYDDRTSDDRTRMVSTILGAVAGGLASNAIANRVEDSRERDRTRQQEWERRHYREEEEIRYESGRSSRERDYRRDWVLPPPEDDDDLVYDAPRYEDRRIRYRRSEESQRYRV